jgi:multimeric flavodoxin WrbA
MKILVIHGSMRKGKTYTLTKEVMEWLSSKPAIEFIEFSVADLKLPFCTSCHVCFKKGEEHCPNFAVYGDVYKALLDCDGLILSGTTYMWALNAAMKNLLDHLSFNFHRPVLFGKRGIVVATSAGAGEKGVAKYLRTVLGQWGVNGALVVTRNTKEEQLISSEKLNAKIQRVSERFYQQLTSGRPIPPDLRSVAIHNAFRSTSLSASSEYERDTVFWQQDGYRNRAYPVKAGLKYIVGALMFGIAKNTTKLLEKRIARQSSE